MSKKSNRINPENDNRFLTLPEAATQLGLPVSTLRRAVNAGHISTHQMFNTRRRVRLGDVLAAIQTARGIEQ